LPRAAWVLCLGIFLNRFGTFVIPFLTLYLTRKGYTTRDAGLAIGFYGGGTLLACFIGGHLADHLGRRKTIALSMAGGAVTMVALSFARTRWGIFLIAGLNGLAGDLYRPASNALLADLVPPSQRLIAYSAYRMALNAGWAFGPATAGLLTSFSYRWLFWGDAFSSTLFGLVAWFALPVGVRSAREQSGWAVAIRHFKQNGRFLQILAASLFIAPIFYQMSSTYGLFVTKLGYSASTYGALISLNGVVVVCFELLISNISRRYEARRVIAIGYVLVGVGFGANAFAVSIPALAGGMILFTFGEMMTLPVSSAYISGLAPESMRGRYMGAQSLTWSTALVFAPALGIFLLAQGKAVLWTACALSGLAGALIISWNFKDRE
jgi:MFS family permease